MIADPCVAICSDRCAQDGDPPCYEIHRDTPAGQRGQQWKPCHECLLDAGITPIETIDPDAVIRPLI